MVILSAIYWTKADEGLSVAEAFTSLSLISLVTQPLVAILVSLMQIAGVFGGCGRIQAFLKLEEQKDGRSSLESLPSAGHRHSTSEKTPSALQKEDQIATPQETPAVSIQEATFQTDDEVTLLKDINLVVLRGTLNMIVGRVGCGKSSLLKAIVGELVPATGHVRAENSVGYCDQIPWLRNTTIKNNIIGQSLFDEKWFDMVLRSCTLDEDMHQLPEGYETIVGSGGVALSGGQKQRVASSSLPFRAFLILQGPRPSCILTKVAHYPGRRL